MSAKEVKGAPPSSLAHNDIDVVAPHQRHVIAPAHPRGNSNGGRTMMFDPNAEALVLRSFDLMREGRLADFERDVHPNWVNHEAKAEPPASRQMHGPAAAYATAQWLRGAFADLSWEIHEVLAEGDLAVVHCTMSGRHTGPIVSYDDNAEVKAAFPPTGRSFATTQTHWNRVQDGKLIEHWANRDDLGTAEQLGWTPPSPIYLVRMALAKRSARTYQAARGLESRPPG